MKNTVIVIAFILCQINLFAQKNDSLISFNEKIEWTLFKGIPNNDTLGASITSSIYLEVGKANIWNGRILFKAYALMHPFESWVKSGYGDEYTLQHEQTHFNITEACARGLQTELNKLKIKSRKSPAIQSTFIKWQGKMEDLQKQYDQDTKGSNDREVQNAWNEKALKELKG